MSPYSNMPGVLRRRQHVKIRHAQRGDDAKGEDHGGRDYSDLSMSQGMPRIGGITRS